MSEDIHAPIAYRLAVSLGKPFGLRWVGDNELAIIYEMEQYLGVKGPGFFRINPLTQAVRSIISIAPDFIKVNLANVQTKDALQIEILMALAYRFDPRLAKAREQAALFVKWTREVQRAIVADNAQRALQAILPVYFAEQVCRGEVFERIEQEFQSVLKTRLAALALEPLFNMVQAVKVPPALQTRFEAVVQRNVNVEDIKRYEPYDLTQAMRTEALEALAAMQGSGHINMLDMTPVIAPQLGEGQSPPRRLTRPKSRL